MAKLRHVSRHHEQAHKGAVRGMLNRRIAKRQVALDSADFSTEQQSILITIKGAVMQIPTEEGLRKVVLSA